MSSEFEDKQALYELMCRYCNAVDRKQFERLRPLYQSTATHDHGDMYQGDPEGFIDFLRENMRDMTTQHMIGNHLYHIEGDRAEGEIYTVNYHIIQHPEVDIEYVAGGRYIDHYVKQEGHWLISYRKRLIDWSHEGPSQHSQFELPLSGPQDPGYGLLKNLYPDN